MKWKKSGSITVEASFLIAFAIMICGILISLGINVYQRGWYTLSASEIMLTGANSMVQREGGGEESLEKRWRNLKKQNPIEARDVTESLDLSESSVQIILEGKTPVWGNRKLPVKIRLSQKIIKPVKYIRKIHALKVKGIVGK